MTGYGEPHLTRARQSGADAVLVKPLDWTTLRTHIRTAQRPAARRVASLLNRTLLRSTRYRPRPTRVATVEPSPSRSGLRGLRRQGRRLRLATRLGTTTDTLCVPPLLPPGLTHTGVKTSVAMA